MWCGELVAGTTAQSNWDCVFPALVEGGWPPLGLVRHEKRTISMKKLSLGMAAVLALLSIAGCAQYVGKGKAPPPVVTKG
jgi:hypothetical protein